MTKTNTNKASRKKEKSLLSYAQVKRKSRQEKPKKIIEEEKIEGREIKATVCNLIVHGDEEGIDETQNELKREDRNMFKIQ